MNMQVRHTGIVIRDMERSLEFYRDLIGLRISIDTIAKSMFLDTIWGVIGLELRMVKLIDIFHDNSNTDKPMIELLEYQFDRLDINQKIKYDNINNRDIGDAHFAFTVNDLKEEYNRLKSKVEFTGPPQINPEKTEIVCFCRDPDNNMIEFVQDLEKNYDTEAPRKQLYRIPISNTPNVRLEK